MTSDALHPARAGRAEPRTWGLRAPVLSALFPLTPHPRFHRVVGTWLRLVPASPTPSLALALQLPWPAVPALAAWLWFLSPLRA